MPAMDLDSPSTIKPGYPLDCFARTADATGRMMAVNFEVGKTPTVGQKVDSSEFIEMVDYPFLVRLWSSTSLRQPCSGQAKKTKKVGKHYPDG